MSRKWSSEGVVRCIQRRHRNKHKLNSNHIQTKVPRLYGAANRYFGSWSQAVKSAGLDYSKLRKKEPMRSWSKTAITGEIIRRNNKGLSIRGGIVCIEDRDLYTASMRHFGKTGWAKARVLAGFSPVDPNPNKKWNEDTVVIEIMRLHDNCVELNPASIQTGDFRYIFSAGCKVFGKWSKAIKAAGLDYAKIKKRRTPGWWTKARVSMCIRNLERRGIRLNSRSIQYSHGSLFQASIRCFGCWSQAVESAGIPYRRHSLVWSYKAWLRKMKPREYRKLLTDTKRKSKERRKK